MQDSKERLCGELCKSCESCKFFKVFKSCESCVAIVLCLARVVVAKICAGVALDTKELCGSIEVCDVAFPCTHNAHRKTQNIGFSRGGIIIPFLLCEKL